MRNLTTLASIALAVATLGATSAYAGDRPLAKYEPPEGKVLVFVGQDNASVGGQEDYSDGYVDHFGTPECQRTVAGKNGGRSLCSSNRRHV
jgi:hypothetical protein